MKKIIVNLHVYDKFLAKCVDWSNECEVSKCMFFDTYTFNDFLDFKDFFYKEFSENYWTKMEYIKLFDSFEKTIYDVFFYNL